VAQLFTCADAGVIYRGRTFRALLRPHLNTAWPRREVRYLNSIHLICARRLGVDHLRPGVLANTA